MCGSEFGEEYQLWVAHAFDENCLRVSSATEEEKVLLKEYRPAWAAHTPPYSSGTGCSFMGPRRVSILFYSILNARLVAKMM